MKETMSQVSLDSIQYYASKTLLYFDIFNYPLKSSEVFQFLGTNSITERDVVTALDALAASKRVYRFREFYSIQANETNVARRLKGNAEAQRFLELARRKAKFIARFPFVRGVFASGSLSKNYMDEKSDLDFFIVTAPKRLWIARMILVIYKRLFLFNSHKYFCLNYYVDEKHLDIEEQNLFTATELATVIPLYGAKQYRELITRNDWLLRYFPNYEPRSIDGVPNETSAGLKKLMESFINIFFADSLERYFQSMTVNRWKRIYQKDYTVSDFKVAFKSKDHASKNHPRNYQRKVMDLYEEKLRSHGVASAHFAEHKTGS